MIQRKFEGFGCHSTLFATQQTVGKMNNEFKRKAFAEPDAPFSTSAQALLCRIYSEQTISEATWRSQLLYVDSSAGKSAVTNQVARLALERLQCDQLQLQRTPSDPLHAVCVSSLLTFAKFPWPSCLHQHLLIVNQSTVAVILIFLWVPCFSQLLFGIYFVFILVHVNLT